MQNLLFIRSTFKYQKALARLEKSIRSGQFGRLTIQKKQQFFSRVSRYARQLNINVKQTVVTACLAAGLCIAQSAQAQQTFALQTGSANPASVVTGSTLYKPTFVDIDGDGDMDLFVAWQIGTIHYYKNTGSKSAPAFTEQIGVNNPLDLIGTPPRLSAPSFVDIDGDGDMDAFVSQSKGIVRFYKNTGTKTAPVFEVQSDTNNPLFGAAITSNTTPVFTDIDGDGDMDFFKGEASGVISYFKNTGTTTIPVFTAQAGAANVLNAVDVDFFSTPAFMDIDADGDLDFVTGSYKDGVQTWKNTGTKLAPVFSRQTGTDNPFSAVSAFYSAPAFVDIDDDGDLDVFFGTGSAGLLYYQNTSTPLPLHLISFSGTRQEYSNLLQWKTTEEVNTRLFEIQRSSDAKSFTTIATIATNNQKSNSYNMMDSDLLSGNIFYRLKMVDQDDSYAYSRIIQIKTETVNTVSLYPNPSSGIVNISNGSAVLAKTHAQIYDASGKLNQSIYINSQQQMDVNPLASGLYLIKFSDGSVRRLIKK